MTIDSAVTLTKQGIARHQAGDIPDAMRLLVQAVQADPLYEMAWLWLASCLSAPGEKRYCLDQAMIANPQSAPAQKGLAALGAVQWIMPLALRAVAVVAPPLKPAKKPLSNMSIFLVVTMAVVLVWIGSSFIPRGSSPAAPAVYRPDPISAFVMCKQFVTEQLKSPATAVFPTFGDAGTQTEQLSAVQFRASAFVDSQNSFGATLRMGYTCTVSSTGGKNWRLDKLTTSED